MRQAGGDPVFLRPRKDLQKRVGWGRGSSRIWIVSGTSHVFLYDFSYDLGGWWWNTKPLPRTLSLLGYLRGVCVCARMLVCLTLADEVGSLVNKAFVCSCGGG